MRQISTIFFISVAAFAGTWKVDTSHSTIQFRVKHMMVTNVTGQIPGLEGTVEINDADSMLTMASLSVPLNKIDTHNGDRDKHLRSADFFDTDKHPKAMFKLKGMKKEGDKWTLVGDLTIRGVTKEVAFETEGVGPAQKDPWGKVKRGFSASTKINRKDFGVNWNKTLDAGGVVVGEMVDVMVDVELEQAQKPAAASKKS